MSVNGLAIKACHGGVQWLGTPACATLLRPSCFAFSKTSWNREGGKPISRESKPTPTK